MKKNIELVQRLLKEQANQVDTSVYDSFFSPDVVIYGPAIDQKVRGLEELKKFEVSHNKAYPDKKYIVDGIFGEGDRVVVQWTCRGKHKGKFKGIQPQNPHFAVSGCSIYRISKGRIAEIWRFWDRLGLFEQIGEVRLPRDPVKPGYYLGILKGLGLENYAEAAQLLTKRERQCLRALLEGKTAKETAFLYTLSPRTVEFYFQKMKKKLKSYSKRDLFTVAQILEKLELL